MSHNFIIKGSQLGVSLVLAGILSACAVPVKAPDNTGFTDAQKAAISSLVASTLMDNPQILVDAVNKLHAQQASAAHQAAVSSIVSQASALIGSPYSPSIGPDTAQTVVVEFMDYQCSYCHQDGYSC